MFNTRSIKKKPATHALKLFLTGKRKSHEVTRQPQSLGSFAFQKAWIWGQEFLKIDKKRSLELRKFKTPLLRKFKLPY